MKYVEMWCKNRTNAEFPLTDQSITALQVSEQYLVRSRSVTVGYGRHEGCARVL